VTILMSYRDSKADGIDRVYERHEAAPGLQMLKPGVFPGRFGLPDLHIIHMRRELATGDLLLLLSLTDHPLSEEERESIIAGAVEFLTA
jgi:hypothetical protein